MKATKFYDEYWNHAAHKVVRWTPSEGVITPEEEKLFTRWLPRDATCLDYGCGDGSRYGRALSERGVNYRGFDISSVALEQARGQGLSVGELDATGKSSLDRESVDAAICFEVLEHLQEPQNALAEILRCLKPGGHVLLSVPNAAFWIQRLLFLATGFWCPGGSPITARQEPWRDPHIRFFHPRMLRQLAIRSGFEVALELGESFTLGAVPFVWRKPSLRKIADVFSRPIAWLGRLLPSWFAPRLFLVARKPAALS